MERRFQIEQLAFEIYENSGRVEGRDLENWLEAERIVMKSEAYEGELENQPAEVEKKSKPKGKKELQEV